MQDAADKVTTCRICGRLSTQNPCDTCADPSRDTTMICVVEEDSALWAMERVGAFSGRYHVLGGLLSALDGVRRRICGSTRSSRGCVMAISTRSSWPCRPPSRARRRRITLPTA